MPRNIIIHADGACSGNPGPGGWAATIRTEGETDVILLKGGDPHTTNNIMELRGAQSALAHLLDRPGGLPAGSNIILRLDSEYVLKGLRDWLPSWKRKGWKTASGSPVKNREIWEGIDHLRNMVSSSSRIELVHVRGHPGDPDNERVDNEAAATRDRSRKETGPGFDSPVAPIPDATPGPGWSRPARINPSPGTPVSSLPLPAPR